MSASVHTPLLFADAARLAMLCALVREQRAAQVRPGSEQELVWHALVPPNFRRPLSPPAPAAAGAALPATAAEQPCNPS